MQASVATLPEKLSRSAETATANISVIIPTRNEENSIHSAIEHLRDSGVREVIVVDGGSSDQTCAQARAAGATVIESPAGRGMQQNRGATEATGDVLLFLHADTRLPSGFIEEVDRVLSRTGVSAGAFRLGVDGGGRGLRWVENMANWRSLYCQLPYGDQAIFMKAETFRRAGGFAEIPLMEDFELMRRLRKSGRIELADATVRTSARRWKQLGVFRATWSNQLCILAYMLGISPRRIAAWRDAHGN